MSRPTSIRVISFLQKDSAILPTDGNKLYDELSIQLGKDSRAKVIIDFTDMKYITSAFINASIGKYVMQFPQSIGRMNFITTPEQELEFRIQRSISLATDEKLRKAHKTATEEILCY